MTTLDEVLKEPTRDDALDVLIAFARLAGFPTTSWTVFSLARQLFEAEGSYFAELGKAIKNIAASGFNRLASGRWLDILSENFYGNVRKPAITTEGIVQLSDAGNIGPVTKGPGELWVANADASRRYVSAEGFTLLRGGTTSVRVKGESPGVAWNLGNGTLVQLVTSIPGVTVRNPDPGTGSWIVVRGDDAETDASLQQRNEDKWSTIGSAANEAAYRYWATTLVSEVRRVKIIESSIGDGRVSMFLAGTGGAASPTAVATVDAYCQVNVRPLCSRLATNPAGQRDVPIVGVVFVSQGYDVSRVLSRAQEALSGHFSALPIGAPLYTAAIVDVLMEVPGIYNVDVADFSAALGPTEVAVPNFAFLSATR
ncbi:baseplate J/gp47 family protein [Pendulispora brunnea]|uniref:Baseplate J/gp47 family protein n=1 Tax=Pendulispora brunnea TaxID=2905690 RepID=A0ABZ2KAI4_9BACT